MATDLAALLSELEAVGQAHRAGSVAGTNGTADTVVGGTVADVGYLLPTVEVAERLGKSESYVRRLARGRRLPGRRAPGGGWEFDPLDVDDFQRGTA